MHHLTPILHHAIRTWRYALAHLHEVAVALILEGNKLHLFTFFGVVAVLIVIFAVQALRGEVV